MNKNLTLIYCILGSLALASLTFFIPNRDVSIIFNSRFDAAIPYTLRSQLTSTVYLSRDIGIVLTILFSIWLIGKNVKDYFTI